MTREEAIEELQSMCDHLHAHGICDKDSNMLTACKMAISALEQQPCEAVSREDALKSLIDNTDFEGWELSQALEAIEKLPSVTRQTKWIPVSERLPEEYGEYLITWTTSMNTYPHNAFIAICEYEVTSEYDHEHYRFKGEWLLDDYIKNYPDVKVIAWMPLPTPYEPQERSEKE